MGALTRALTIGAHSPARHASACPFDFVVFAAALHSSDEKGIFRAMADFCTAQVCPSPKKADFFQTCADHSVHSFQADFKEKVTKRNGLQYTVFFVAVGLIFGGGASSILLWRAVVALRGLRAQCVCTTHAYARSPSASARTLCSLLPNPLPLLSQSSRCSAPGCRTRSSSSSSA